MRHTSLISRRAQRVCVIVLAGLPLVTACGDDGPSSPVSPGTPGQPAVQSIAVTGNTTLQRPNDSVQLTAAATLADGTTRDITAEASWSSDHPDVVTVSRGRLTARAFGECNVTVYYNGVSNRVAVRVWPDGMFKVSGRITAESGLPLMAARVTTTMSPSPVTVTTNRDGLYLLPALGDVEVRAEMDGLEPQSRRVTVMQDTTLHFELRARKTGEFSGVYTMVLLASPSCTLPSGTTRRTYLVRVTATASGDITGDVLAPEMVAWDLAGFTGTRSGPVAQIFFRSDFSFFDYSFVELLDDGRELALDGTARGEVGDTFAAPFNGEIVVRTRAGSTIASCTASNHRLEFSR